MKRHLTHITLGGVIGPVALAIAAAIGNGAQQALHLGLHGTGLAIFLVGFVAGASLVTTQSVKLEAVRLMKDAGPLLGKLLAGAIKPPGEPGASTPRGSTAAGPGPLGATPLPAPPGQPTPTFTSPRTPRKVADRPEA